MSLSQKQVQTTSQSQRAELRQLMLTKMLEVSNDALEDLVQRELEENSALELDPSEESDDPAHDEIPDDYLDDDAEPEEKEIESERKEAIEDFYNSDNDNWESPYYNEANGEKEPMEFVIPMKVTSWDNLNQQLDEMLLDEHQHAIAEFLLGSLDDTGYLTKPLENIVGDLYLCSNIRTTVEEVRDIIANVIHSLDPAGIGAKDLQECLLIQLRRIQQSDPSPVVNMAIDILQNHYKEFANARMDAIAQKMKVDREQIAEVFSLVKKLVPYPGGLNAETQYVSPDFNIFIENGELRVESTSDYRPRLRVNAEYEQMMARMRAAKKKEAAKFISDSIDKARAFIQTLPDRDRTLYLITNEIVKRQKEYFLTGNAKYVKPMVLKDVAESVGMDISTISRATSRRYVQTPFGLLLLKDLFSEGNSDGVSSIAVMEVIKEVVAEEDKSQPYSDDKIQSILKERGYSISRRTVAKYRESVGIPNSTNRRQ